MQNYRFICTALALHITIASFAGQKRTHPDDQESSKSTKRARTGATQHDLNKELLAAAEKNQWEVVYALLRLGANIETKDVDGWTPLHFAARNGHCQAIETLIQHNVNKEATLRVGWTPLHIASIRGHCPAIETLIKHGSHLIPHVENAILPAENILTPLENYYRYQVTKQYTMQTTPFLQYLIKVSLDATAGNGNTILHRFFLQRYFSLHKHRNESLLYHILHHPSFTAFNAKHKNMFGYNALHICADKNPYLLQTLYNALTLGKTSEEIKRLIKATTPCGDTINSLKSQPNASPNSSWTPLMHTVFSIPSLTAQSEALLKQRLKSTDDPAYVTDEYDSALSVARCEEVKNMIREDIRQKRRAQIFAYLIDEHQQPNVLADLQLQFAGTYEPSQ